MPAFILLFLVVPLVEIYLLIEVGQVIGALPTVGLCVLTAVVGGALLRYQGFQTMVRAQQNLQRGRIPAIEMFEGVALAIGGALLLTPGFATDVIGFLCLVPWSRRAMIRAAMRRMQVSYGPPPARWSARWSGGRPGG
ncbi:MAG: FxsA family protein [Halofilum sp. (in: g-proteobacteria)]|nr:FxsA family protein [Halofilum sp. (in: g-proteobacteria)]